MKTTSRRMARFGTRLGVLLVGAAVVLAGFSTSALAQGGNRQGNNRGAGGPGGPGFGGFGGFGRDLMEPEFTSRQIDKYSDMLGLTADQKAAVKTLYDGYSEEAKAAAEKMRTKMEEVRSEFRDTQDPSVFSKMQDSIKAFRDARKKMDEGFTNDVKAVLTPKQLEAWPTVERAQRRDTGMRRGFISGERVDLISLLQDLKPSADTMTTLKPILDRYELDLDRELVRRTDFQEKSMEKVGELMRSGDMEGAQKLIQEGRDLSIKVRDVNRNFAKQIATALPEDQKAAFNDAFKKASFPDVYRTTQATTELKAAGAFSDLTPAQKDSIAALTGSYEKSLATVNDKLAAAQEDAEMKFNIADMRNRFRGGGDGEESQVQTVRREKRELDRTTTDSLKKILTEAQAAKLPKPEQDGFGRGGGRGGQNGQGGQGRRRNGGGQPGNGDT